MLTKTETDVSAEFRTYVKGNCIMKTEEKKSIKKDSSLKTRVLTSLICAPVLIIILLGPPLLVTLTVIAASVAGLYEYYKAVGLLEHKPLCAMGFLAACIIPPGLMLSVSEVLILVYVYVVALFLIMLILNKRISINSVAMLVLGIIYIPYFLSYVVHIRSMEFGRFFIWFVFIGAFSTDTCAYFAGRFFGKHKLSPNISPKKTIEGAIGGVLGAGLVFVLFGVIANNLFAGFLDGKHFSLSVLFVFGIISAVISEVGDLVASSIKRCYDIKDFGNILPGHGGILDRCDSIILVAPTVFLFLSNIPVLI